MTAPLFSLKNLSNFDQYIKLGLPGVVIMLIDWGSYEILALWSAIFGVSAQTSLILVVNFISIPYQI